MSICCTFTNNFKTKVKGEMAKVLNGKATFPGKLTKELNNPEQVGIVEP